MAYLVDIEEVEKAWAESGVTSRLTIQSAIRDASSTFKMSGQIWTEYDQWDNNPESDQLFQYIWFKIWPELIYF